MKKFHELKITYQQAKSRLQQLEKGIGKENQPSNVLRTNLESENQMLQKRIQELEDLNSHIQTDDMKNEAMNRLKEDNETVQKKYEMAKRLCTLRNDDITKLKSEVDKLKLKYMELQKESDSKLERMQKKYNMAKEIAEFRRLKIAELGGEP